MKLKSLTKTATKILIGFLLLLVIIRIILPTVIKYAINDTLENKVPGYTGHIADFDLALWRGAYRVEGLTFNKRSGKTIEPLIDIDTIEVSLAWRALFKGFVLMDIRLIHPNLVIIDSKDAEQKQVAKGTKPKDWREVYRTLVPFKIERLVVQQGELHAKNYDVKVPLDVFFNRIDLLVTNINNSEGIAGQAPTSANFEGYFQNSTPLYVKAKLNIAADPMIADLNLKIENFPLKKLNRAFKLYFPFDVNEGEMSLYSEIVTKNGKMKGYIKPFLKDVDVIAAAERYQSFPEVGWEWGSAFANLILRNSKSDVTAAKVPFETKAGQIEFDSWDAIKSALKNGFGDPLPAKIDNTISLKSIPGKIKKEKSKEEKF